MARRADGASGSRAAPRRRGVEGDWSRAEAVERRLRRLDAGAWAALVADLRAARGFETRRADDVVVATRRGESVTIYPLPSARIGSPPPPDRPVDVVVDPRGRRAGEEIADAHDARVVDAAGLRAALFYGVDRGTTADLCERHLGARPEALRPPLATRVRERTPGLPAVALGAALAVLLIGAFVIAGTPAGDVGGSGLAAPPTGDAGSGTGDVSPGEPRGTAAAETPTARPSWPAGPAVVPGLDRDGVEDPAALAAAHERALRNRSYTLWIDHRGPGGDGANATRTHRDTDVAVDGGRYLAVTSVGDDARDGDREVVRVVYRDGGDRYVAASADRNASHRQTDDAGPPVDPTDPGTTTPVRRYLSTPETTVDGTVTRGGRTHYRIVGRGPPTGLGREGIRNYTVVAVVSRTGIVRDLTATYTVDVGRPATVRREWTYGRIGATTVDRPAWYGRRDANGTRTPAARGTTATPG